MGAVLLPVIKGVLPPYPTAHTTAPIQNNHLFVVHSHRSISYALIHAENLKQNECKYVLDYEISKENVKRKRKIVFFKF